ncbi:MAG: acetylornithine deacetylase [Pseudomonadota bacterium]
MIASVACDRIIEHLSALVGFDSQNPPRDIRADGAMFQYVHAQLAHDFHIQRFDHGNGHVTLLAERGRTDTLFNCHLDTVPVGEGWTDSPFELVLRNGRAYGRGSCDIKGAAAVLLALAEATTVPMALLFTSDEEGAGGCCVDRFLNTDAAERYRRVVVCEPTACQAVLSHRGFLSVKGQFHGRAGHSSEARALQDNAIHRFGHWLADALTYCQDEADAGRDTCFNAGTVSGGLKSNVIADQLNVHWSARLLPGQDNQALLNRLSATTDAEVAEWLVPFSGPPLPIAGRTLDAAREWMTSVGVDIHERVDFWTEAALFSRGGKDAVVLGPGHIEQAHTVDEWVELDQLERAASCYARVLDANHREAGHD